MNSYLPKVSVNDLSVQLALAFGPEVKEEPTSDKEDDASQEDAPAGAPSGAKVSVKKRILTRRDSLIDINVVGHVMYFGYAMYFCERYSNHYNHWISVALD